MTFKIFVSLVSPFLQMSLKHSACHTFRVSGHLRWAPFRDSFSSVFGAARFIEDLRKGFKSMAGVVKVYYGDCRSIRFLFCLTTLKAAASQVTVTRSPTSKLCAAPMSSFCSDACFSLICSCSQPDSLSDEGCLRWIVAAVQAERTRSKNDLFTVFVRYLYGI